MAMQTNWDEYYSRPAKTAPAARKVTEKKLLRILQMYSGDTHAAKILELGGANSCFYAAISTELAPQQYWIMDNNRTGLQRFHTSFPSAKNVQLWEKDVLNLEPAKERADIVFSTGLIEHFDVEGTRKCIQAHFQMVRKGGLVLITFPTPTWLYRATRKVIEWLGMWIFHDERPLPFEEVRDEAQKYGSIVHESITWPIFLTQGVIAVQVDKVL